MTASSDKPVLILGGAGFIGCNLAHRLLVEGRSVRIFDNLSRPGVEDNLAWLIAAHGSMPGPAQPRLEVAVGDIRNRAAVRAAVRGPSGVACVFHLAAQVAVTTSLADPLLDLEVNIAGTLNLLEELRAVSEAGGEVPPLVFTSTNKVYGALEDVALRPAESRYEPEDPVLRASGVGEERRLDLRTPYGCSKGAADQYVLDYARTFGLPAVVLRMSCIYGPHQHGTEEQGWVAHILRRALEHGGITIYGDGKQVRDVLFVGDLVDAFLAAWAHIHGLSGRAFNIGGGPGCTLSVVELVELAEELVGELAGSTAALPVQWMPWRPADQRYFVADTRAFHKATGWQPTTDVRAGARALLCWLAEGHAASAQRQPRQEPEPGRRRASQSSRDHSEPRSPKSKNPRTSRII